MNSLLTSAIAGELILSARTASGSGGARPAMAYKDLSVLPGVTGGSSSIAGRPIGAIAAAWGSPVNAVSSINGTFARADLIGAITRPAERSQEEAVFDRRSALKIATSQVAMHLDEAWRAGLFRSLDRLIDAEEWDFTDELPSEASYRTFLRVIVFLGRIRRPALGATSAGNVVAGWMVDRRDRLTIECAPADHVRWALVQWPKEGSDDEPETAAGRTLATRLPDVLRPYDPQRWFSVAIDPRP